MRHRRPHGRGEERLRAFYVAVADLYPGFGPFVGVEAAQAAQRFARVLGHDADQRIGVALGARLHLGLQLVERPLRRQRGS